MLPTLADGDRLLVRRLVGPGSPDHRPGSAESLAGAAAPWPSTAAPRPGALVVVRLPGDRPDAVKRLFGRQDGGWWVERDNPAEGVDSWLVGAIPDDGLLGVVRARLWPRPRIFRS
jgi:hypothetical protein